MQRRIGDTGVTSVFIIAASDVVRAGLESLIAEEAALTVAGSAVDWSTLAGQGTDGESPDVVIFDAEGHEEETLRSLPGYLEELSEGHNVPALIVIGAEREAWVREALRAGVVRAMLPRSASSGEIIATIGAVSTGLMVLDAETLAAVLPPSTSTVDDSSNAETYDQRASLEPLLDDLTPREREVLEMLAEGFSNKEIAWRMNISEHTIKFHVASIFSKLGASTRTEAVMLGIRKGLVMI